MSKKLGTLTIVSWLFAIASACFVEYVKYLHKEERRALKAR